jgi:hypothetical protein
MWGDPFNNGKMQESLEYPKKVKGLEAYTLTNANNSQFKWKVALTCSESKI